eukprot:Awhi_evm1s4160
MRVMQLICSLIVANSLSVFGVTQRRRDADGLAPELNKDHPHRERTSLHSSFQVCFHKTTSNSDWEDFDSVFDEFILKRLPNFDVVHLEIPNDLIEDVITEIRSLQYVEAVEHVISLFEHHQLYWNIARVISRTSNGKSKAQVKGSGF